MHITSIYLFSDILDINYFVIKDGEEFHKLKECYIRGNNIKYLRMGDAILKKSEQEYMKQCMEFVLSIFCIGIGMRGKRGRRGFPFRGGNIQNIVSQISKAEELEEDTKNHKFSIKGCMNV
jgi:hypothetical protein